MKTNPTCISCKNSPCNCTGRKPPPPQEALKTAIDDIISSMPAQIKFIKIKAELCRSYYNELIKQGFKETEALELCKYFQI